jgi:microsomal dipeptidase-like Zn-dependent dipeptidase
MNNYRIDNLQYCNWSKEIFQINNEAKLNAIHVTIAYHENFNEVEENVKTWNKYFKEFKDLIFHGKTFKDIEKAHKEKKTAVFFGFQNCSPIGDNIGLVEEIHKLGIVFMQLTYNNQSLLATGCYEENDSGVTRMGKEVIKEMNKLGVVVDMSHSAEKSTLDAIKISSKPIAITHANPSFWFTAKRNKSNEVLKALADSGGMVGLSLYPHHLKDKSNCTLESFCEMIAKTTESGCPIQRSEPIPICLIPIKSAVLATISQKLSSVQFDLSFKW